MVGRLGVSCAFSIVYLYPVELFPTPIRNATMVGFGKSGYYCLDPENDTFVVTNRFPPLPPQGICSLAARIGGILAPMLGVLGSVSEALPFIMFGAIGIVSVVESDAFHRHRLPVSYHCPPPHPSPIAFPSPTCTIHIAVVGPPLSPPP